MTKDFDGEDGKKDHSIIIIHCPVNSAPSSLINESNININYQYIALSLENTILPCTCTCIYIYTQLLNDHMR